LPLREYWLGPDVDGRLRAYQRVNNSLIYMRRDARVLARYIALCERVIAETPPQDIRHYSAGTELLTRMANEAALPLIPGAALLSPPLVAELAAGGSALLRRYAPLLPEPLVCANLCASMVGREMAGTLLDEPAMERAVAALLASRGGAINAFIPR